MNRYIWIIPLIAVIVIGIMLFWIIPTEHSMKDQMQQIEVEELKRENKALIQTNGLLDDKIELLELITDSLETAVLVDQQRIEILKQGKDEKIKAISDFTDDELYRYFAGFNTKDTTARQ